MISDLDEIIKQIRIKEGKLDPSEVDIVFDMPDREWSGSISKPTVNIYIYDIRENTEFRRNGRIVEGDDNGSAPSRRGSEKGGRGYTLDKSVSLI